ncbi:major facilitator superfamily domain-containing protein 10 isoform X2 [Seriola aureovittata]|uniref:major facilitator superfamily domain-containing protein 10 isoform X2 n=1 Tax=Seriola aureovittata TaxID=2871759 RepID=UPI0024BE239B|nr:major facilitator superfamily domain-containing protein 10 isoform X2 [Seriola aureovittata]
MHKQGMQYISLCRVSWTGSGRLLGFLWKRNTTVSCLEVTGLICELLNSPFRSDRVTVFAAAVPVITYNRCSVRPAWQTAPAPSYHSECDAKRIVILGLMSSYAVWAVSRSFSMFLLFRVIGGICKGNVSLCTAIVADLPCPKVRNRGMAMIGIAFSLGFTMGPLMGAYFAISSRATGNVFYQTPALLALAFSVADLVFIWLMLPETLTKDVKASSSGFGDSRDLLNPLSLFYFSAVTRTKDPPSKEKMQKLQVLGLVYFCYLFLFSGLEFTLSFLTHQRFQFTSMQQGKMFFFIGVIMALIQGGYARRIKPGHHIKAVRVAIITLIPAFILIGLSWNITMLYIGLALYSFAAAIVVPCLSTLVSDHGSASQKGTVMGILRSLGALARALGPVVSSSVYWIAGAQTCFLITSASFIVPLTLLSTARRLKEE